MPIYQRNGKTYNIPDSEVGGFEKTYPDATQKYVANGRNYNIPVSERNGFLSTYKDAALFTEASSTINDNKNDGEPAIEDSQRMDSVKDNKPIIQEKGADASTDNEHKEQERKRIEEQIAQQKQVTDERLKKAYQEHSKKEKEEDDKKGWFRKILEGVSEAGRDVHRGFPLSPIHTDENIRNLHAASESVSKAEELVNEAKYKDETGLVAGFSGFGRGFWDKMLKLSTWDMGMLDMSKNTSILNAAHKYDQNQPLTNEEETLLDAVALEAAANGEFSGDIGRGYKAGSTTAESLPFMAEFMVNPATGTGKAVSKAAAKKIIANFGKEAAKSTIGKIARNSVRVAGDIAGAGIMAGTTGAMRTTADAVDRSIGEVKPVVDSDGYYRFGGTEGGDGALEAFIKAYGAGTIEDFSEMFGNYLAPIGSVIGTGLGKGMNKIGLGRVNKVIGDIKSSDIAKVLDDFQAKTQWNGTIGEYLEEQAGMAMNALTVGDNSLSDMVDIDTQIDTFLGVSAFGGLFSTIKTAGYAKQKYSAKQKLNEADHLAANNSVIDEQDWDDLKEKINQADDSELVSILSETLGNDNISDEGKQAVLLYAGRLKAYHGASLADLKRKTEGDTPDEIVQSQINFDEGYKLAEADRSEKRRAFSDMNELAQKLDDEFLYAADDDRYKLIRQRADAGEDVSDELAYINSQSRFDGMILGIRYAIDEKVSKSNQYITNLTHQDGNIYDVTLAADENKHIFIVNGSIVADENGIIDKKQSDTRFIVRDDTGKVAMRSVDDLYKLEASDNAEALKEVTAQTIREQESARYAEEIETPSEDETAKEVALIQPGDVISLNMQGIVTTAIVQSKRDGSTILQFEEPIEYNGKKSHAIELSDEQVQSMIIPEAENTDALVDTNVKNNGFPLEEQSNLLNNEGAIITNEVPVAPAIENTPINVEAVGDLPVQEQMTVSPVEVDGVQGNQTVAIPVDKKGNKIYHKVPVDVSLEDMRTYGLDDVETDEFVNSQKIEAAKRFEKLQKGKPKVGTNLEKYQMDKKAWTDEMADAQAQTDYWNEVEAQLQAIRERPGDITAKEIKSLGEPMNGGELAAAMLGNGNLPLLYGDYKRETGFSNTDARGMFGMFASKENGGMTIEQAGEQLMLADLENGTNFFDQNDPNAGRNAILDVLSSARTRGGLIDYIKNNREVMAERERQAELEADERAKEQWFHDNLHMTPKEYELWNQGELFTESNMISDEDYQEFMSNFVDKILNEQENDRRTSQASRSSIAESESNEQGGISGVRESSGPVLQGEESISAGTTGRIEEESSQTNANGSTEYDALQGSASGREIIEKLRNSVSASITGDEITPDDDLKVYKKNALEYGKSLRGAYVNRDTGESIFIGKNGIKEVLNHNYKDVEQLQSIAAIPQIIENSIYIDSLPNTDSKINAERFDYYVCGLNIGGVEYTVRAVFVMPKDGTRYYDHKLTKIEKGKLLDSLFGITTPGFNQTTSLNSEYKDIKLISILQGVYDKKEAPTPIDKTTDTGENRNDLQSDTALLQDVSSSSEDKGNEDSEKKQVNSKFIAPSHMEGESLLDYAVRVNDAHLLHLEEKKVDTNPTEGQKEAGNYRKGHIKIDGFDITIENPKGSERSGVDADGKSWSVTMNNTYGYIRGTEGVDGDHIDLFLGDSGNGVYVVDQMKEDGSFDEHKVMYGFGSMEEARDAYLSNYSPGWNGLGNIKGVSKETFKEWVDSSHRKTKPFAEYKIAQNKKPWQITAKEYTYSVGSPKMEIEIDSGVSFHQLSKMSGSAKNARMKQRIEERNTANSKYRLAVKEWENKVWDAYLNGEFSANDVYDTEAFYVLSERINELGVDLDSPFKISKRNPKERETYLKRIDSALSEKKLRVERKKDLENVNTNLREPKVESEEQSIMERTKANETYMKAPNGKPSRLDERQWVQVRTHTFKEWFGDWENEPENSSKVVDENGEPLVVYHGTSTGGFSIFNTYGSNFGLFGQGSYFTDIREVAESYMDKGNGNSKQVYGVFLNIRRPLDMNSHNIVEGWKEALPDEINVEIGEDSTNESVYKSVLDSFEYNEYPKSEAQEILYDLPVALGYDGVTHIGGGRYNKKSDTRHQVWIAIEPTQIKSATDNMGEFSGENGDIRFREVYHGSGVEFDKFDLAHSGKGEGESMIGKGIYTTQDKRIAEEYARVAGNREVAGKKHLYEVEIPADNGGNYLDYDKVYDAAEMSEIAGRLHNAGVDIDFNRYFHGGKASGKNLYTAMAWNMPEGVEVNQVLSDAGYVGYKYSTRHDLGGKKKRFPKKSYVVFEESNATITGHEQIVSEIEKISDTLHMPVKIARSLDELPEGAARQAIQKGRNVKGWFDTKTGEVVIYLPNATGEEDAKATFLHEVVGHRGLRALLGEKSYDDEIVRLYGLLPDEDRKTVANAAVHDYGGNVAIAMDEYLAEQAEKDETPSWWNKVVSAIRDLLREKGIDVKLSNNDVKYLLWRSRKKLENNNILSQAEDVVMRKELGIGKHANGDNNDINEYLEQEISLFNNAYNSKQNTILRGSMTDEQLREAGIDDEHVDVVREILNDGKTLAGFVPSLNKILIFADNISESYLSKIESTLFHENLHGILNDMYGEENRNIAQTFYDSAKDHYKKLDSFLRSNYNIDEVPEEFFVYMLENDMSEGNFDRYSKFFKNEELETLNLILKKIGYDKQREGRRRTDNSTNPGKREMWNGSSSGINEKKDNREVFGTAEESFGRGNKGNIDGDGARSEEWKAKMDMRNSENVGEPAEEGGKGKSLDAGERGLSETESRREKVNLFSLAEQIVKDDEINRRGIRFRVGEEVDDQQQGNESIAQSWYENALDKAKNKMYRWQEAYQDSMLGLKRMQEAIEKEIGAKLKHFEDAYMAENQMSSKSAFETEVYKDKFLIPMLNAIKAITDKGVNRGDVNVYVMAKHGLERNKVFAWRDAIRLIEENDGKDAADKLQKEHDNLISALKGKLNLGEIGNEEYEKQEFAIRSSLIPEYAENRLRDYSGLTQLTGEEGYEKAAKELVDSFEYSHTDLCDTLWQKINLATRNSLKKSYESGLMTRGIYEKMKSMFDYYVPLRGFSDDVASDVYDYILSENSPFNAPIQAAKGRKSQADDPFATIGNMAESGILQGNRNLMKQKFLNMVLNHPTSLATVKTMWYENAGTSDNAVWEQSFPFIEKDATPDEITQAIDDHEKRMIELEKNGMAKKSNKMINLAYRASKREKSEHTVVVKSGGKEYVIYVNGNPRAAQAINGLTNPDAMDHKFMQMIGKLNRQLAANFTTRNPAFVLSNASRDIVFSTSAIWIKEDWKYAKRFDKNVIKNIKAIVGLMARYKSGKLDIRNSRDRYFLEFLENGGETGYTALHNVEEYKKMMDRHIKKSNGAVGSVSSGIHAIIDAISFMNRCAENVSRFTTYQTSREMGRGISESVRDAKEVTVNFNKKGAGGLGAGTFKSLFLFFNAAIQSLNNFKGLHDKSKSKFYTSIGGFATAGILVPMINNAIIEMLVGDGDDDMTDEERVEWMKKKDAYDNLPEWVRRNNFCIWVGGDRFITIPLPIELRAFYGLGEMWYQMGKGNMNGIDGKVDVKKASLDMVNQLTELLPINPLGGNGNGLSVLVPDAGKPLYQAFTNRDFFGKPIYKKNDYNELMPAWTKAFNGTAKWMVNSAEFLNELSGDGDKYKRGDIDVNPATIEHLFEGYFGGMGKTANQLYKTISMIWDEDERMWRNVPVANRFISGCDNKIEFRKVNEVYYQCIDELKETEQRLRGYENEAEMGIEEYAEKYDFLNESKENERYLVMKEYKSIIDDIYKSIKESDPDEKKEMEMEANLLKMEMIDELSKIK